MSFFKTANWRRSIRMFLTATCIIIVVLVALRIHYINANAFPLPNVERYAMNEWVELNGAFLNTKSENTEGYSMRVTKAELLSYNGYIEKYGLDKDKRVLGLDELSLICLEIEVKNIGNEEGVIFIFECKLIPDRKNTYFIPSTDLWAESENTMEDGSVRVLMIKKDSEYIVHIPYKVNVKDIDGGYAEYRKPMKDTSFILVVSNLPVRNVIFIEL